MSFLEYRSCAATVLVCSWLSRPDLFPGRGISWPSSLSSASHNVSAPSSVSFLGFGGGVINVLFRTEDPTALYFSICHPLPKNCLSSRLRAKVVYRSKLGIFTVNLVTCLLSGTSVAMLSYHFLPRVRGLCSHRLLTYMHTHQRRIFYNVKYLNDYLNQKATDEHRIIYICK